ncbi:hypothetical protein LCGC14_2399650, partial [marine sediment metagenome]
MTWDIHTEEFVAWAKAYEGPRFHAVLCDPPYGLRFMGKDWDRVSAKEWGEAMMPLLYPGAIVFMFGGTRTWHKLATGMEEAGFEIWDTLMWLHGQGFPKAQDVSKLIDKEGGFNRNIAKHRRADREGYRIETQGTPSLPPTETSSPWQGHKTAALKPAWEPILCFRAPRQGKSYAELAMEYGSGALNVDGARVGYQSETDKSSATPQGECTNRSGRLAGKAQGGGERTKFERPEQKGRYPANLVLDEESAEMLDEQRPFTSQTGNRKVKHRVQQETMSTPFSRGQDAPEYTDSGGPSRFFYCAKASRSEREAGLEGFDGEQRDLSRRPDQKAMNDGEGNPYNRGVVKVRNNHPTVKPITLIKWLATLLLPPDSVKPRR